MNLRRILGAAAALAALPVLYACYPGGPDSAADTGLVITSRVDGADYANLATFGMSDEVILLDAGSPTPPDPLPGEVNEAILDELRAQMLAAGFQDVSPDTAAADVWLQVGANQVEVFYYYSWGGYWPGWSYYPPYVGVGSFQAGSVVWDLVDLRNAAPGGDGITSIWYGGLNGALSNANSTTASRVRDGIRQAFRQSPYLQGAAQQEVE